MSSHQPLSMSCKCRHFQLLLPVFLWKQFFPSLQSKSIQRDIHDKFLSYLYLVPHQAFMPNENRPCCCSSLIILHCHLRCGEMIKSGSKYAFQYFSGGCSITATGNSISHFVISSLGRCSATLGFMPISDGN